MNPYPSRWLAKLFASVSVAVAPAFGFTAITTRHFRGFELSDVGFILSWSKIAERGFYLVSTHFRSFVQFRSVE